MSAWLVFVLIFGLVLLVPFTLVVVSTIRKKGRWGINFTPKVCPDCKRSLPRGQVRVPKSVRQALWGGSTCMNCGCEVDKWGNKIESGRK